ncbi:hypothetical protein [Amphritea sp. HPY]|uniref:hypothetical protein n=1 Tax=Amphritea sp. HPY TaxID=3421652 RepID=UPI003D7DA656
MYTYETDLCFDFGADGCEFTVVFEGKIELTDEDRAILFSLLKSVVELDSIVARKMNSYKDYEFELSYITVGSTILFSYCGVNVNSTWEFEFIIEAGDNYSFTSKFE